MPRLRHGIAPGLTQVKTEGFPAFEAEPLPSKGTEIWLGIGGNLDDPIRRFQRLRRFLNRQPDLHLIESSPILINPPFGYPEQPDFANAVLRLRTSLPPMKLLRRILEIERKYGRRRSFKNAPRTLDIDLLFYGRHRIDRPHLRVPHPGWRERISVWWPLVRMRRFGPDRRTVIRAARLAKKWRLSRRRRNRRMVTEH